jgi:UDP-N-acetylmuramyl tripeptide synthase
MEPKGIYETYRVALRCPFERAHKCTDVTSETILIAIGGGNISIPITMNGIADFQIANVLAAVAAVRALGSPVDLRHLETFNNTEHNPGRNNLYRVGKGYALIDYKMAKRWPGAGVTGIIGVPGGRADRILADAARTAAESFDRIIIKEDHDLRGRRPVRWLTSYATP